jgi:hypothetical protein
VPLELVLPMFGQLWVVDELPLEPDDPLPVEALALGEADEPVCASACCTPTPPTSTPVARVIATAALLIRPVISCSPPSVSGPANRPNLSGSRERAEEA